MFFFFLFEFLNCGSGRDWFPDEDIGDAEYRRVIRGQFFPHPVIQDGKQPQRDQKGTSGVRHREDLHEHVHGVHGCVEERHSQYASSRAVIYPAKQDGDKRQEHDPVGEMPFATELHEIDGQMPRRPEEP